MALLLPHSCHWHPSSLLVWIGGSGNSSSLKMCPFVIDGSTATCSTGELRDWGLEKPGTTGRRILRRGSSAKPSHSLGVEVSCSSSRNVVASIATAAAAAAAASASASSSPSTSMSRIVTFVGKGGVGKTFSAVLAAQYYASLGLRTALAVQSLDTTADFLLGSKLGTYAAPLIQGNLTAFRVEATKLLREPWSQLKEADARLNFSQGALNEVVSDELGILPGMDSILAIGLLDRLSGITGDLINSKSKTNANRYDVVVYDGPSSEETLRIFGAAERARWYLKRLRSLADKTDAGRVALPSILRTVGTSILNEPAESSTAEIWASVESLLSRIIAAFADPRRFGCFIVTKPGERFAHEAAVRYWGCAVQAGVHVSGVLPLRHSATEELEQRSSAHNLDDYSPLPLAEIPHFPFSASPDWMKLLSELEPEAGQVLIGQYHKATSPVVPPSVAVDKSTRTVTLFLPGFAKTEVKVSQVGFLQIAFKASFSCTRCCDEGNQFLWDEVHGNSHPPQVIGVLGFEIDVHLKLADGAFSYYILAGVIRVPTQLGVLLSGSTLSFAQSLWKLETVQQIVMEPADNMQNAETRGHRRYREDYVYCTWRGNTELLVEVGDQRRSVLLPPGMQGKVVGAKFRDRSLIVTIGKS